MGEFVAQESQVSPFEFRGVQSRALMITKDDDECPTASGDNDFIDDRGVNEMPYIGVGDKPAGSSGDSMELIQTEEGAKDKKPGRMRNRKYPAEEIASLVEQFISRLVVAAEDDVNCNRRSLRAIHKLEMLHELVGMLTRPELKGAFLDRGVLSVLKNWLEPLPDGSLPNLTIRNSLLNLLNDLHIDVAQSQRCDQLKKSGIGKVLRFLSLLPEESQRNRKLARVLLQKWGVGH